MIEHLNNSYIFNAKIIVSINNKSNKSNQDQFNEIEKKCLACLTEDIDFAIYLYSPNLEALSVWIHDLESWKKKHPQSIISRDNILMIGEYRKTDDWLEAKRNVDKLLTDPAEKSIFSKMADDIVKRLSSRRSENISSIKDELFKEVTDVVSWLIPKTNEEKKSPKFENMVNLLIYDCDLPKISYHMLRQADKMGYRANSLVFGRNIMERKNLFLKKQKSQDGNPISEQMTKLSKSL